MICIALAGQSPPYEMFSTVDSFAAETPRANTKMWSGSCWDPVTGVGAIALCNRIGAGLAAAGLDDEVRIYNCAVGGSALIAGDASPSTNHWSAGGAPLAAMFAQVTAGCTIPDVVVWWQGWQDYLFTRSNMRGDYETALGTLFSCWKTTWSKPDLLMNVWPAGRCNYGSPAPASSPYVQAAQISFATSAAGAMLGPCNHDAALRDGVHQTGKAYKTSGIRGAIAILAQLKMPGFEDIEMPRVTSVSRLSQWVMLNTNADLFPQSLVAAIVQCTGIQAWDDVWSVVPIYSAATLGTQLSITLQWVTGAHLVYQRGIDQSIDRLIFTKIKGVLFPLTPVADENQFHA